MSKVIVHIDLNAFFVRCEEIKDPSLEGKAVAIGHEGRSGIVSTCSYEARKFGVHSGMPMFQATEACSHLIIKHGDYRFYSMMSHQFMEFVKSYTPIMEQASVDECFADFTLPLKGIKDVDGYFREFQKELYKKTKLMCSIGVATTKFVAKMASDYQKPMGLTIIRNKDVPKMLFPLEIEKMFGVGKKTYPRLRQVGVKTIGDLYNRIEKEDEEIKNIMGKFFYTAKDWLNCKGSDEIEVEPWNPKSIGNSTTLAHDTIEFSELKETFLLLAKEVSARAIKERKLGNTIQITVKDIEFNSHNKSMTIDNAINDEKTIYKVACDLYEKNFLGTNVRLLGITLQNLIDPQDMAIQMTLFDYETHEEQSKTKLLINDLNRKLKKPNLVRASEVKKK